MLSLRCWLTDSARYVADAARSEMLLGSHLAGAAIENSMLGAAHALSNPLTGLCGVVHGVAVGMMLFTATVAVVYYRASSGVRGE